MEIQCHSVQMTIDTQLVDTYAGLVSLEDQWQKLHRDSRCGNPFSSYEWNISWWRHLAPSDAKPQILLVKHDSQLIGIAPLYLRKLFPGIGVYQLIGTGRTDYPDVIALDEYAEQVIGALADFLRQSAGWFDLIDLHEVMANGPRLEQFKEVFKSKRLCVHSRSKDIAPFIAIGTEDWDELLRSKSNKFRKAMNKKERRLLSKGNISITKYDNIDKSVAHFADLFEFASAIERKSWKFKNGTERINTDENSKAWFKDLLKLFAKNGWLDFWVYERDDQPLAYAINFNLSGRIFAYNSAYDESESLNGPGALMHIFRIRDAATSGIKRYDFLRGNEPYKFEWANGQHELSQLIVCKSIFNPAGWMIKVRWLLAKSDVLKSFKLKLVGVAHKLRRSA